MSKPEVILHHYQGSPYAQKVIAALRVKGIPWYSVNTAPLLPRPRIPVLQIGNNIYCDTALIIEELERRYPDENATLPSFPGAGLAISNMISTWVDKQLFGDVSNQMPWGATPEEQKLSPLHAAFGNKEFLADRSKLTGGKPMNTEAIRKAQPLLLDQLLSDLDTLEGALQGPMQALNRFPRPEGGWILGTVLPSYADFSVYCMIWWILVTKRTPEHINPEVYPYVFEWYKQMNDCMKKHRHPTQDQVKLRGEDALEIARQASINSSNKGFTAVNQSVYPQELRKVGDFVSVSPNDYGKIPVKGQILEITRTRVSIRPEPLETHRDIEVIIHFPRRGYIITLDTKASL
ncbi:hypothetical protein BGZ76_002594 [Entomortierella beljakovae]|nr:hypothetical protein BGZ76_002594 [Entomortierella beljakovae]